MVDVAAILEEVFGEGRCLLGARVSGSLKRLEKRRFPSTPPGVSGHTCEGRVSGPEPEGAREGLSYQAVVSPDTRAHRTHRSPTREAAEAADFVAFHERAAVAEHDGELGRDEAETMAAREQGYETADAFLAAVVAGWTRNVDRLVGRGLADPEIARALDEAVAFLRDGWALQAVRLGWGEIELFGVSAEASPRRLVWTGAAFGGAVHAVTSNAIIRSGGRRSCRSAVDPEGAVPIWDLDGKR